jgi:hypothetical protein
VGLGAVSTLAGGFAESTGLAATGPAGPRASDAVDWAAVVVAVAPALAGAAALATKFGLAQNATRTNLLAPFDGTAGFSAGRPRLPGIVDAVDRAVDVAAGFSLSDCAAGVAAMLGMLEDLALTRLRAFAARFGALSPVVPSAHSAVMRAVDKMGANLLGGQAGFTTVSRKTGGGANADLGQVTTRLAAGCPVTEEGLLAINGACPAVAWNRVDTERAFFASERRLGGDFAGLVHATGRSA